MMKNVTQAKKLAAVLQAGYTIRTKTYEELKEELNKPGTYLYTLEYRIDELWKNEKAGYVYYIAESSKEEYDTIAQFTLNPFTLIDIVMFEIS